MIGRGVSLPQGAALLSRLRGDQGRKVLEASLRSGSGTPTLKDTWNKDNSAYVNGIQKTAAA